MGVTPIIIIIPTQTMRNLHQKIPPLPRVVRGLKKYSWRPHEKNKTNNIRKLRGKTSLPVKSEFLVFL
jgi:hypothetical protein